MTAAVTCRSTLIWGSPGTGKTSVAIDILRHWSDADAALLSSHCYHNLATSDTNVNVDNMAGRLSESGLCVRRIGRKKAVREENRCLMLGLPAEQRRQFRDTQVVACTAMGVGGDVFDGMTFARVLVDEAAQISEPSVLVPLARGCLQLAQMGDFKQLPPTVTQEKALATGLELSARGASQGCCNIPIVAAAETFTQISARDWVFCVKGWPPRQSGCFSLSFPTALRANLLMCNDEGAGAGWGAKDPRDPKGPQGPQGSLSLSLSP